MTYTLTPGSSVIRDADGASIPHDQGNKDYREYLAWLKAGNTPTPYVAPPPPPPPPSFHARDLMAQITALVQKASAVSIP